MNEHAKYRVEVLTEKGESATLFLTEEELTALELELDGKLPTIVELKTEEGKILQSNKIFKITKVSLLDTRV